MQKHESAFTLIELMITIAVVAVALTVGVPSFNNVIERNQLTVHINELVSTLHFARSEAVRRNTNVGICHSDDGSSCGGAGYEDGWIIFTDINNDGDYADTNEELIRVNDGLPNNYTMHTNSLGLFKYDAKGKAGSGRIVLCKNNDLTKSRAIFINTSGRTRLAPLNIDGIPEKTPGVPITECSPS